MHVLAAAPDDQTAVADCEQCFLSLVGLLSAMLAAVAVAMAARRFMQRHLDTCAMLRCLGMTQNEVGMQFLVKLALAGLAGNVLGLLVGFGAHFVLIEMGKNLIQAELPPVSLLPALRDIFTGILPPVLQLRNVPHNRVLGECRRGCGRVRRCHLR
jgi:putative ABC transport system permease protein